MRDEAGLAGRLEATAAEVEATLEALLPAVEGPHGRLYEAMRYATLSGGKRLRAFLVMAGAELFQVSPARALRVAAAIEMVHAYSLIHDDLPAMDDALLRRGRPACHLAFDEATAILAGDALLTLAVEILADAPTHPDAVVRCELIRALTRAAGPAGMCGGQMQDLLGENRALDLEAVARMERLKTGALMGFSAAAGALLAAAPGEVQGALGRYGEELGLAFQIKDDLIDATGDAAAAGKDLGRDECAGKATFVSLLGVEGAERALRAQANRAAGCLAGFGDDAATLRQVVEFVVGRRA
jgi:farnesyl diphosphate synthase